MISVDKEWLSTSRVCGDGDDGDDDDDDDDGDGDDDGGGDDDDDDDDDDDNMHYLQQRCFQAAGPRADIPTQNVTVFECGTRTQLTATAHTSPWPTSQKQNKTKNQFET